MAKFDNNLIGLRVDDDLAGLKRRDLKAQEIDFRGKSDPDDFMSQLDRMTKAAQSRQYQQAVEIKLNALDLEPGLVSDQMRQGESPVERLLREAKELVAEGQYESALEPLTSILAEVAVHPEATYLIAYCRVYLKEPERALHHLLGLRAVRLEHALATRVEALKEEIRGRMLSSVLLENVLLIKLEQYDEAIRRLRRIVGLDPEVGYYHFMLSGSLMMAERFEEAITAINLGLRECQGEARAMLGGFKLQIEQHYVAKLMEPARTLFKQESYGRARTVLNGLDPAYRQTPLFITFANYLGKLDGGMFRILRRKTSAKPAPAGEPRDVEALYFFLIGQEIQQATKLLAEGKYGPAETVITGALAHTPHFAYARFLLAGCTYSRIANQISSDSPPGINEVIAGLEQARQNARIGATDAEITDAPALLGNIEQALQMIESQRMERQASQAEIKLVNEAIEEFQAIMKSAEGGISSPTHFNDVYRRMSNLKKRLPGLHKQVRGKDAAEAVKQLDGAIDRNTKQLESIKAGIAEADTVKHYYERFKTKMKALEARGGIRDFREKIEVRSFFLSLQREIEAEKPRLRDREAREHLDKLLEAVKIILSQMEV
jgi:tetratricopeptide (TPR) repeat protein